jgi:HK97 family phage portal protein
VRVDPETALRSTVVLACVRVLSSSVAGLPLHLYRRTAEGGKEIARDNPLYRVLHDRPNSWQTSYEWRETLMLHLLTHGNAYVEITGAGPNTELIVLHPSRMKVDRVESGRLRYTYREDKGGQTVYSQDAIMHLRWISDDSVNGMVPVELAKDAIGLTRALEIHGATYFGNGARPGVVLTTDQMLSPEAAENTRTQWERAHRGPDRANRTAVLQGGLKIAELGGNNVEAQFLDSRRFQIEEVCRLFGVPPHLVGDLSRSSFSNIEQQSLDYVQNGLMPFLRRIESAIARDLITDEDTFAEFDTRGALRADAAGRSAYYQTLWNLGVASVNEIRSWENLNPVEGGDTRFVQLNMTTLEKAAADPEPVPVVEEIVVDEQPAEPVAEPVADPAAPETPQLAEVSLNGAQISGILEILAQMNQGLLTPEAAKALMLAAFPSLPMANVDQIIAGTSTQPLVEPEPEAAAPEPVAEEAAASRNCGTGEGGFGPGNTCGKGGGEGGGDKPTPKVQKERLRDRIEGTQAEADLEVTKAKRKARDLEKKLADVKQQISKLETGKQAIQEAYRQGLEKARAERERKVAESQERLAKRLEAIRKKFKRNLDDDIDEADGEIEELRRELMQAIAALNAVESEIDQFMKEVAEEIAGESAVEESAYGKPKRKPRKRTNPEE